MPPELICVLGDFWGQILNFHPERCMITRRLPVKSFLLISLGALWSCSQEKDQDPGPASALASMTCTFAGKSWKAASFQNTLVKGMDNNGVTGKRLDIRGTSSDGSTIILTISDPSSGAEGDGVKLDTYYTHIFRNLPPTYVSGTPVKAALGTYTILTSGVFYISGVTDDEEQGEEGEVKITQCDAAKKTISGTFFFKALNPSDNSQVSITSGAFTNLSYQVIR